MIGPEVIDVKKKFYIIALVIVICLLISSCYSYSCTVCGTQMNDAQSCPICYAIVCESCADPFYFFESHTAEAIEYLESNGYVIFNDTNEAFELYSYGFINGYNKGFKGIQDDEYENAESYNYDKLREKYDKYGW